MKGNAQAKHLAGTPCSLVPSMLTLRCTRCKHTVNIKIMSFNCSVVARCPLSSSESGKGLVANSELTLFRLKTTSTCAGFFEGGECCSNVTQSLLSFELLEISAKKIPTAVLNANWNNLIKMKSNCASQSRVFVDRAPSALLPHAAPKALLLSAFHKH